MFKKKKKKKRGVKKNKMAKSIDLELIKEEEFKALSLNDPKVLGIIEIKYYKSESGIFEKIYNLFRKDGSSEEYSNPENKQKMFNNFYDSDVVPVLVFGTGQENKLNEIIGISMEEYKENDGI